jgi:hypothetical protein
MKKPIPTFRTDKQAEDFVAKADLSDYDLSGGQVVRFGMRPKGQGGQSAAAGEAVGGRAGRGQARRCSLSALHPHGDRKRPP